MADENEITPDIKQLQAELKRKNTYIESLKGELETATTSMASLKSAHAAELTGYQKEQETIQASWNADRQKFGRVRTMLGAGIDDDDVHDLLLRKHGKEENAGKFGEWFEGIKAAPPAYLTPFLNGGSVDAPAAGSGAEVTAGTTTEVVEAPKVHIPGNDGVTPAQVIASDLDVSAMSAADYKENRAAIMASLTSG